jgi:hypothetical protein
MNLLTIGKNYLVWHYSTAISDIVHIWLNYLWFINHLFSVPDVAKSLFAPFKRLQEEKANFLLHPEEYFSNILINLIMRIVGFMLRGALLAMALLSFLTVVSGGILFFAIWLALPVLVPTFLVNGISMLLS